MLGYVIKYRSLPMNIKKYIDGLVSKGRHFFSTEELKKEIGLSSSAMWSSLSRLKKKGEIVSPSKGYYLIVPLEYRSLGSLPPEQFIHNLMKHLQIPYYVGLLSAAQRYGAAHQQPQVFQVLVPKHRRSIKIGRVKISFFINKYLLEATTREFNTPRGIVILSSPETTALDLVAYSYHCGGLSNVLTVLGELIEQMNIEKFKEALLSIREYPTIQRLGYLFELLDANEFADAVEKHLGPHFLTNVPLDTRNPSKEGEIRVRWRLTINEDLENDL